MMGGVCPIPNRSKSDEGEYLLQFIPTPIKLGSPTKNTIEQILGSWMEVFGRTMPTPMDSWKTRTAVALTLPNVNGTPVLPREFRCKRQLSLWRGSSSVQTSVFRARGNDAPAQLMSRIFWLLQTVIKSIFGFYLWTQLGGVYPQLSGSKCGRQHQHRSSQDFWAMEYQKRPAHVWSCGDCPRNYSQIMNAIDVSRCCFPGSRPLELSCRCSK